MQRVAHLAMVWAALAPAGVAGQAADPALRETAAGAVYHANCLSATGAEPLIAYLQGTGLGPGASRQFLRHVGDRTGRCVVAVPYENSRLVASYCLADSASGSQDADCLGMVLSAKAASAPARVVTRSGGVLEVPVARSAEGALLAALRTLGLTPYLTPDRQAVDWERVVLTGASQGAQVALFIAIARHRVAGVGSIVGGVLPSAGVRPFPPFVYQAGRTPAERIRAFHHVADADQFRRAVYQAMRIPEANIRTTAVEGGDCAARPHPCVIIDDYLPLIDGVPAVVDDWLWVATPDRAVLLPRRSGPR